jgi:N-acetylmuramoyl-L-alanine amidase
MISKTFSIYLCLLLSAISVVAGPITRVIIDPGHGGKDDGAKWGGVKESDLNLKVAKKLEALLLARNFKVTMTRRSDVFVTLERRWEIMNSFEDAIFVSIHFNAHRITSIVGVETFYASPEGELMARNIQREVVERVKTRNRYIKPGVAYAVLNQAQCPAVLVECGFISNTKERNRCNTDEYQMLAAQGIETGIIQSIPVLEKFEEVEKLEAVAQELEEKALMLEEKAQKLRDEAKKLAEAKLLEEAKVEEENLEDNLEEDQVEEEDTVEGSLQ